MHSKWGFHLSHAVSHALYYLAFGECCLVWKRWLVPLQSSQISLFDGEGLGGKLNHFEHELTVSLGIWHWKIYVFKNPKDDWVV